MTSYFERAIAVAMVILARVCIALAVATWVLGVYVALGG